MTTTKHADYRIEDVQKATVNGRSVKMFTVFKRDGDAFVHFGKFTAPVKTPNRDLIKFAVEQG